MRGRLFRTASATGSSPQRNRPPAPQPLEVLEGDRPCVIDPLPAWLDSGQGIPGERPPVLTPGGEGLQGGASGVPRRRRAAAPPFGEHGRYQLRVEFGDRPVAVQGLDEGVRAWR